MSLYDANRYHTGADGGQSDGFAIFNTLSDFDLTDQKTNLTRTVSGMMRGDVGLRQWGAGGSVDVFDYLRDRQALALLQRGAGMMSESAYARSQGWNDFIRELYSL